MPTQIDSLSIKIETEAKEAGNGIDKLAKSLEKLNKALAASTGFGELVTLANVVSTAAENLGNDSTQKIEALAVALGNLGRTMKSVNIPESAISGIRELGIASRDLQGDVADKLLNLGTGLQALATIKDIKISSSIATQITAITQALDQTSAGSMAKAAEVAAAIRQFADIGKINIPSTLGDTLFNIGAAAEMLATVDMSSLGQLASALMPLVTLPTSHLTSTFNQLKRLPEVMNALKSVDMDAFADAVKRVSDALQPLSQNLTNINSGLKGLAPMMEKTAAGIDKVGTNAQKAGGGISNFGLRLGVAYAVARRVGSVIAGWVNESNRYIENLNLFNASMGKYAAEAQNYAEKVGDLMGIDPSDWMRNQGVFMTLATGFGIAGDRANYMSQQLTQLGYDLSSFFNIAVEGEGGAMQKLQAGLAGELEPLRRLGFDLSQAKLQMIAYDLGIQKTYNDMTQAEKAQLRYYAILTQVSTAHGDMARTINSPANQIRILQAQVQQCARAFGNIFIPALNAVLPVAIAVAKALRIVAAAIAQLFGFVLPDVDYSNITSGLDDVAGGMDDIKTGANGAGKAVKKLKSYLMGFDELNVIEPPQDDAGGGGGGGGNNGLQSNWDWDLPGYDFLAGLVDNTVDVWMAKFQPAIDWTTSHLELIGGLIATAGAALLAWKFADTFLPNLKGAHDLIAGISGMVLGAITATITVGLSYVLANDYDQTGDYSSLIASGLTSVLGAAIAGGVVAKATGNGTYGLTATGVTLAISGLANLSLTLGNISKNGINKNNLISLAWEGIKTAVGVGMIAHTIPALKDCALEVGGLTLGLIATAGLILGAKQAIEEDEHFTPRVIALVGAAAGAFSATLNSVAKQFKWEKVNGVWTFFAAASAGLAVTAGAAVLKSGKVTWDALVAQGVSSAAAAIAASNLAKQYGLADKNALLMGVGVFSLSAGVQMVIDTFSVVKAEGLSGTSGMLQLGTLISGIISGSALAAAMNLSVISGATAGLALAAAATIVVTLVALSVRSQTEDVSKLPDYGTINATKEQLQDYFNTKFNIPVMATAEVVSTIVKDMDYKATELNTKILAFQSRINSIVVGAKVDGDSVNDMIDQLNTTIIPDLNTLIDTQGEAVQLGVTLVPPKNSEGADLDPAAILNAFGLSADALKGAVDDFGTQLGDLLAKSVTDGLNDQEKAMVANLTLWLSNIQKALQQGQVAGEFQGAIQLSLADLDSASFTNAVAVYEEYKTKVIDALTEIELKSHGVLEGQKAALEETKRAYELSGQAVPQAVTDAIAAIDAAMEGWDPATSIAAATADAIDPARQEMISALHKIFDGVFEQEELIDMAFFDFGDLLKQSVGYGDTEGAITAIQNMVQDVLTSAMNPEDYTIAMDAAKVLGLTGWDVLSSDMQTQLFNAISAAVGNENAKKLFKSAGLDLGNLIKAGLVEADYASGAKQISDKAQQGFNKNKPVMAVAVGLDDPEYNTVNDIIRNRKMGKGNPEVQIKPVIPGKPATVSGYTKENLMGTTDVEQKVKVGLAGKHQTVSENIAKTKMGKVEVLQKVKVGLNGKYPTVSENIAKTKMGKTPVDQGVGLTKDGWVNVYGWVDVFNTGAVYANIDLTKDWEGTTVAEGVKNKWGAGVLKMPVEIEKKPGNSLTWTFRQGGTALAPQYMLYERGGFPPTGQAFVAREAGPELVGNIGRRSAVVNNDQIVESVSGGVREANTDVVNAIYTLIAAVEAKDMNVSFSDDDVGRAADRYHMKRGATVNTGAFANAY